MNKKINYILDKLYNQNLEVTFI